MQIFRSDHSKNRNNFKSNIEMATSKKLVFLPLVLSILLQKTDADINLEDLSSTTTPTTTVTPSKFLLLLLRASESPLSIDEYNYLPSQLIKKRSSGMESNESMNDLETLEGTNLLRPLFVYRRHHQQQQLQKSIYRLPYQQRLQKR